MHYVIYNKITGVIIKQLFCPAGSERVLLMNLNSDEDLLAVDEFKDSSHFVDLSTNQLVKM